MNNKLIQQLREGKIAVKNDGTLEELQKVIKLAFPDLINSTPFGDEKYYVVDKLRTSMWTCYNSTDLPSKSVKDFLTEEEWIPKRGERILVKYKNGIKWEEKIYLATIEGALYPIVCVNMDYEADFCKGNKFHTVGWSEMKKLEPKETVVSMEEIAKKFNVPLEQLRIKD